MVLDAGPATPRVQEDNTLEHGAIQLSIASSLRALLKRVILWSSFILGILCWSLLKRSISPLPARKDLLPDVRVSCGGDDRWDGRGAERAAPMAAKGQFQFEGSMSRRVRRCAFFLASSSFLPCLILPCTSGLLFSYCTNQLTLLFFCLPLFRRRRSKFPLPVVWSVPHALFIVFAPWVKEINKKKYASSCLNW
jgi:hypothetical protein